jgi:hypothetical protein
MAQQAPIAPPNPAPPAADTKGLVPPDESFWIRYSPHHEFPLASVSSFVIHALAIVLLLLIGFYLAHLFVKPVHRPPVEAVRLQGGGGGQTHGVGSGPGVDVQPPQEAGKEITQNPVEDTLPEKTERADLTNLKAPDVKVQPNKDPNRFLTQPNAPSTSQSFALLQESLRNKTQWGKAQRAGKGGGGSGSGGGKGDGVGPGEGSGVGPGKGSRELTQREKRMQRWTMNFDTRNGRDYLAQLRGLGAILAIPVKETTSDIDYKIVRNLSSPAQLLNEDLEKIDLVYWYDTRPEDVREIMAALGLNIRPSHFVAFFTKELEAKLTEMEKTALGGRSEEEIDRSIERTYFRVVRVGDRYEPRYERSNPR